MVDPEAQYEQKANITIASGDIPDIMAVNASQLSRLIDDNQLEDLTKAYNEYAAPYTKEVLSSDGGNALKSATFNGKLMALPNMASGYGSAQVLWVRTDWLKKLNLPIPKTMADVFKISEAFKSKDPDGNGKNDTFGLAINKDLIGPSANYFAGLEGFFDGYHAYPNIWVKDASGKLAYGSIQPQTKAALLKLQELYKSGQIDKEYGVKDPSKVKDDINAGKIGMFYGFFWNSGWLQDAKTKNPTVEWTPYSLPSIDDKPAQTQIPFPISTYYVVKKGMKNPEAAIKLLNLPLEKCFGKTAEPEKYSVGTDGNSIFNYILIYGEPPLKNFEAQVNIDKALEAKDDSTLNAEEKSYYKNINAFLAGDIQFWQHIKMYGAGGSLSIINDAVKNKNIMDDQYFGAPTQTMVEKNATLLKLQLEVFTEIIMGGSINEFDKFTNNWKTLGGNQITQEVNAWAAKQK